MKDVPPSYCPPYLDEACSTGPATGRKWLTGEAGPDEGEGRMVCFCYRVGIGRLARAIRAQNLTTPDDIRRALHAGGKCGSCLPELQELLRQIHGEKG